jgi:hypothetical protein
MRFSMPFMEAGWSPNIRQYYLTVSGCEVDKTDEPYLNNCRLFALDEEFLRAQKQEGRYGKSQMQRIFYFPCGSGSRQDI